MKIQISIDVEADELRELLTQSEFNLMPPSKPTSEYTVKELDARIWNWKMLRDSKVASQVYSEVAKRKTSHKK